MSLFNGNFSVDEFFTITEFATIITINNQKIPGIFNNQYVEYTDISGNHPTFLCPSERISNIELGDEIAINHKYTRNRSFFGVILNSMLPIHHQ